MANHTSLLDEIEQCLLDDEPTAELLRKCVVLGGRAGSSELRDWASQELKGYPSNDDLPTYRVVPAVILMDGVSGNNHVTGQRIRPGALPDFTHDHIQEKFHLTPGVGELEEVCSRNEESVRLSLPMGADLVAYMNSESDDPHSHIVELYWSVSRSAIAGCLDQIRTALAELIGEMRAALPVGQTEPAEPQAQQALNVVVRGFGRANVTSTQTQGANTSVTHNPPNQATLLSRIPRAVGVTLVGIATIVSAVLAYLTFIR